jgi:hypothetical protein
VWGTDAGDNIVWGTASDGDNIVWGTVDSRVFSWVATPEGTPVLVGNIDDLTDEQVFAVLSHGPAPVAPPPITLPDSDTPIGTAEPTNPTTSLEPDPTPAAEGSSSVPATATPESAAAPDAVPDANPAGPAEGL